MYKYDCSCGSDMLADSNRFHLRELEYKRVCVAQNNRKLLLIADLPKLISGSSSLALRQ